MLKTYQPPRRQSYFDKKPGGTCASISYSWFASTEKNDEMARDLMEWLSENPEYEAISPPFYAGYNPPWTLPFFEGTMR